MEFLSQENFPSYDGICKSMKVRKEKRKSGEEVSGSSMQIMIPLTSEDVEEAKSAGQELPERIRREAEELGLPVAGTMTVYLGRWNRVTFIDALAAALFPEGHEDLLPEKNLSKIALAAFQMTPDGEYVTSSLSLSPIAWALGRVLKGGKNISENLRDAGYKEEVSSLEKLFFNPDLPGSTECTLEKLSFMYEELVRRYGIGSDEEIQESRFCLLTGRLSAEKAEDEEAEDAYLGLTQSFYLDDLRMLMEKAEKKELFKVENKNLLEYISVLTSEKDEASRKDMIQFREGDNPEKFIRNLSDVLRAELSPMGKWPSRFMPALMQEVAINLATGDEPEGMESIFSVNGPPGTGKTTLLKEIIVSNIVNRAHLICEADKDADEFFEPHSFLYGRFTTGKDQKRVYSKYIPYWYSLKPEYEKINSCGILVTSCNNAAVENISKELPKSVAKDLKPLDNDSEELRRELQNVKNLFSPEASPEGEIYFTKYARELFREKDAWGLVAAPMGKRSNIRNFYDKVMEPLLSDLMKSNKAIEERASSFRAAKKEFEAQWKKVLGIRSEIISRSEKVLEGLFGGLRLRRLEDEYKKLEAEKADADAYIRPGVARLQEEEAELQNQIAEDEAAKDEIRLGMAEIDEEIRRCEEERIRCAGLELKTRPSFLSGIFKSLNAKKHEAANRLADEYRSKAEKLKTEEEDLLRKKAEEAEDLRKKTDILEEHRRKALRLKERRQEITTKSQRLMAELEEASARLNHQREKLASSQSVAESFDDMHTMTFFNMEFFRKLVSDDIQDATKAQVRNPWMTEEYNREREKLFALSLRVQKEFVLSSKACRSNLKTLSQYWGFMSGDEKERVVFDPRDREAMMPALIQTLFLVVPVISSTFASVGRFLKDVKKPGCIGMLIVDEAGQAQPQMALGSLYRARRAVIVGDPKQVEPVVTEDLQILKDAWQGEFPDDYKRKTLSVQSFADGLNAYGTYLENEHGEKDWVGCPLVVHRRCISPMYDISNQISYDGIMKLQTGAPKKEVEDTFICESSRWIDVEGREKGNKNHFVEAQGAEVVRLLDKAFEKTKKPDLYIISPFTTVVSGIREYIRRNYDARQESMEDAAERKEYMLSTQVKRIGTVHTFQGKEANEVIFLLGCDEGKGAEGAITWVNNNIVNVAVTRAKYRLYVVGSKAAWAKSKPVAKALEIMESCKITGGYHGR